MCAVLPLLLVPVAVLDPRPHVGFGHLPVLPLDGPRPLVHDPVAALIVVAGGSPEPRLEEPAAVLPDTAADLLQTLQFVGTLRHALRSSRCLRSRAASAAVNNRRSRLGLRLTISLRHTSPLTRAFTAQRLDIRDVE